MRKILAPALLVSTFLLAGCSSENPDWSACEALQPDSRLIDRYNETKNDAYLEAIRDEALDAIQGIRRSEQVSGEINNLMYDLERSIQSSRFVTRRAVSDYMALLDIGCMDLQRYN